MTALQQCCRTVNQQDTKARLSVGGSCCFFVQWILEDLGPKRTSEIHNVSLFVQFKDWIQFKEYTVRT